LGLLLLAEFAAVCLLTYDPPVVGCLMTRLVASAVFADNTNAQCSFQQTPMQFL